MRILLIAPFGLGRKGTTRARVLPLATALAARGHRVRVLIPAWDVPEEAGRREVRDGVELEFPPRPPLPLLWPGALARRIGPFRPDRIWLFKTVGYGALVPLLPRPRGGGRWAVDLDDWEGAGGWADRDPHPFWRRRLLAWLDRTLPRRLGRASAASRLLAARLRGEGLDPLYLPNGLTAARISFLCQGDRREGRRRAEVEGNAPFLLVYSRLSDVDLELLARTAVALLERVPRAVWGILGRGFGGEERELRERLAAEGIGPDRVRFLGWPGEAALPHLLAAADAAYVPLEDSLIGWSKASVKLLELLGAGVPVVVDAVGEALAYTDLGRTARLVPPGRPERAAEALQGLLADPRSARALGAAARERIWARYRWEVLAGRAEAWLDA